MITTTDALGHRRDLSLESARSLLPTLESAIQTLVMSYLDLNGHDRSAIGRIEIKLHPKEIPE
jgi:hypothetical protein